MTRTPKVRSHLQTRKPSRPGYYHSLTIYSTHTGHLMRNIFVDDATLMSEVSHRTHLSKIINNLGNCCRSSPVARQFWDAIKVREAILSKPHITYNKNYVFCYEFITVR